MVDAPQVQNTPDPISQMQQISPDAGNNLSAGWGKNLDDFINGMIYDFGDKAAALGAAALSKGAEMATRVGDVASKAAAPFKPGFSPSASPAGPDTPSQSVGMEKQRSIEISTGNDQLGQLASPTTPSLGAQQGAGMGR